MAVFPGFIYLIYLSLSRKSKFQKQFIIFLCTVFISNGLIKNIEKFFEFDLITYWFVLVGFLLAFWLFSVKFLLPLCRGLEEMVMNLRNNQYKLTLSQNSNFLILLIKVLIYFSSSFLFFI